jgi:putative transposase
MTSYGPLLTEFQRLLLNQALDKESNPLFRQRIKIMLMADDGYSQAQICSTLGCAQVTARHWMMMAQNGKAHLWQETSLGRPKEVDQAFRDRLRILANSNPRDYGYSAKQWTGRMLGQQMATELGIRVSERYINALLKQMGLSKRYSYPSAPKPEQPVITARSIAIADLAPTPRALDMNTPRINLPSPLRPKFNAMRSENPQ